MQCPARSTSHVFSHSCDNAVFGSRCSAFCTQGYQGLSQTWTCAVDAGPGPATMALLGDDPFCEPLPCHSNFPTGLDYLHNCTNAVTGSTCTVACASSHKGVGVEIWTCLPNDTIMGLYPNC